VHRIWGDFAIDKVLMIKKGLYLVRFEEQQAAMAVAQKGVYYFDQKSFIVKAWSPEMEIQMQSHLCQFGFSCQNWALNTGGSRA